MWKAHYGNDANVKQLVKLLETKTATKEFVEKLENEFKEGKSENKP